MMKRQKISTQLSNQSTVFIATFAPYEQGQRLPANGMVEPMLSFFVPKVKKVFLLVQPHPGSDRIDPIIEDYRDGKLERTYTMPAWSYALIYGFCKWQNTVHTSISFKVRDFYSCLYFGIQGKKQYQFFIGLESINTLAGLLLRKLGKVEYVIYYVSDYSPKRFNKSWFNHLYLALDRYCVRHADIIWDVSPAMMPARFHAGLEKKEYPLIIVPNGLFPTQIKTTLLEKRKPFSLVFMGSLGFENGPDLAIEALAILEKKYPKTSLHIIGGGKNDIIRLKNLANKLGVEKKVTFYGFVVDNNEMAKIVRGCMIGLAPYRAIENSVRWYADATKIRQYTASGLPVVTTQVPPLGKVIVEKRAGIVTRDTAEDYARGIIKLLGNKKLYTIYAKKAAEMSSLNTWENVYSQAFHDINRTVSS